MGKNIKNYNVKTYIKEIPMGKKKKNDVNESAFGCGVIVMGVILLAIALFLTPLLLMLTWNLAICALFPAAPAMTYWIAFGVNWFLNIIGNKFSSNINLVDKVKSMWD